jgi:hypothetical protein
MIWVVVPVISVEGGAAARWTRCTAFWIAIAATRTMPVTIAAALSPVAKGPKRIASAAPMTSSASLAAKSTASAGSPCLRKRSPASRVRMTTAQNTGSAKSFASTPEMPSTSEAPRVTKFPVTCAVNRPCSARNPAVST